MKYANLLHTLGAIIVIAYSIVKLFHIADGTLNGLLTIGILVGYLGLAWKTKLLERQLQELKSKQRR